MAFPQVDKNVVVTGCSTGIGLAAAEALKQHGWRVVTTARKEEDLHRLTAQGFEAVALDIGDAASTAAAADRVMELFQGRVGAVVNNAGFGQSGAVEDIPREAIRHQFEVNVIGLQDFTNRFLPGMRARSGGRIVNISSVLGRISLPYMGVYSASKFAVEALSDALRVELKGTGIAVVLVEPGPIATAFGTNAAARARRTLNLDRGSHAHLYRAELQRRDQVRDKPDPFTLPPEAVAARILHALMSSHPRRRYRVTAPAFMGEAIRRFLPHAVADWMMARAVRRPG